MKLYILFSLLLCIYAQEKKKGKGALQAKAMRTYAESLTEEDYDPKSWVVKYRKQPQYFFEHYIRQLSDVFKDQNAQVNFVMVGACDGTHDMTIRESFLPNDHWRGVFVEPFEINYKDLESFMESHGGKPRAHILHAAATIQCNSSTIKMKRPTFEEKNKSLPHWMRREIGSIVPFDKLDRKASGGWTFEYVPCVNGPMIMSQWGAAIGIPTNRRIRPHILKVDVEGHDYEVLMGFLTDDIPSYSLPLLISFEAKSILSKIDKLREHLEKRGYVVSHPANDGFALLKGSFILPSKESKQLARQQQLEKKEVNEIQQAKKQEEGEEEEPAAAEGEGKEEGEQEADQEAAGTAEEGETGEEGGGEEGEGSSEGGRKKRRKGGKGSGGKRRRKSGGKKRK